MVYTYILESLVAEGRRYIGHTRDLEKRLLEHNSGRCRSTSRYRPWKIKLFVAFDDLYLAGRFERYLKSGSGHAFANRHFYRE